MPFCNDEVTGGASVAVPEIANLQTSIEGRRVRIGYDLIAANPTCIKIKGSNGGGQSYSMRVQHLEGDYGEAVSPGTGKKAYWAALADYPKGFGDQDVIIDVVALSDCR